MRISRLNYSSDTPLTLDNSFLRVVAPLRESPVFRARFTVQLKPKYLSNPTFASFAAFSSIFLSWIL